MQHINKTTHPLPPHPIPASCPPSTYTLSQYPTEKSSGGKVRRGVVRQVKTLSRKAPRVVSPRAPEVDQGQEAHDNISNQGDADGVHVDPFRLVERRGVFVSAKSNACAGGGGGRTHMLLAPSHYRTIKSRLIVYRYIYNQTSAWWWGWRDMIGADMDLPSLNYHSRTLLRYIRT